MKKYHTKQQMNYPRTLTDMYGIMAVFELTGVITVVSGRNEGMNLGKVFADSKGTGNGDPGGGGIARRKLECWHCGGEHLKTNCPKRAEEKEKTKKDDRGKWKSRGADDKRADGET